MRAGRADPHLDWDGCFNVRDLGGHPTVDGRTTRWGAVIRSDTPDRLTPAGWAATAEHGVRTIVDLRDHGERHAARGAPGITTVHVPVMDMRDEGFWSAWRGVHDPPRFYRTALERWPDRFAAAVSAVARAAPGGVLVHCHVGRDRTGLVTALLLALVGVPRAAIAADFALSAERLQPLYARWLAEAADEDSRAALQRDNVSDARVMDTLLQGVDARSFVLAGGASEDDLAALRERLVE